MMIMSRNNDDIEAIESTIPTIPITPAKPIYNLADNALTTLDRAYLMLGIEKPDSKTQMIITLLINKCSAWIESQLGRKLRKQEYIEFHEADGQQELVTKEYPIVDVDYIKEDGNLIDPSSYDYKQDGNIGIIYKDDCFSKLGYRKGLAYDMITLKRAIEVSYTAGYVLPKDATDEEPQTLPADLEGLVWDMLSQAYTSLNNGSQGLTSFSIADVTWVFDKTTASSNASWNSVLKSYRRY